MISQISVFGLGKVGLALAACLSDSGYRVIGVDIDQRLVEETNRGRVYSVEPGLLERVRRRIGQNLIATSDAEKAIYDSELTFIVVPTPSNALGGFSLSYVKKVCEEVGIAIKHKNAYHVIAIVSTILPGSSEYIIMPYLEQVSGRKIGSQIGYCYNPAFIALGEVVKGFIEPDAVFIGESDKKAGDEIVTVHKSLIRNDCPVIRMNPTEVEIAKIASNTYDTMRISFVNMLLSVCNEISGTNIDEITKALSYRWGKRMFKGAVAYGGPCYPRDQVALALVMDTLGISSIIPRSIDQFNAEHAKYVFNKILEISSGQGGTFGLLGLAYKPGTGLIERSFAVDLAIWLADGTRRVIAWDPLAIPQVKSVLGDRVCYANSIDECIQQAQVIAIVNPLKELDNLDWSVVGNRTIIDCWRCLRPEQSAQIKNYRPLGQGIKLNREDLSGKLSLERLRVLTY